MKKLFYPVLFAVLFPAPLAAIYPYVVNFDTKTIKSGTQNWAIVQHQNHWLYFANNYGLLEFDGNRWTTYPVSNYTTVRSLCYDRENDRIYAGAFNEFGYFSRDERGILQYHSLLEKIDPKETDFADIWYIRQIDDNLYFCGAKDIFRYRNGEMKHFRFENGIHYAAAVHHSLIVSVENEGLYFINGDIFVPFPGSEVLSDKKICAILPLNDREILFVSNFHGLFKYNGKKIVRFETDIDDFLITNQVFCAAVSGSRIAFGTIRNGLVVKDLSNNQSIFSNTSSGLQNNTVLSLAFDRQENLWCGLDKGVDYAVIHSPVYSLLGNNNLCGAGYASLVRGKTLYLGTNQGLYTTGYPLKNTAALPDVKLIDRIQGQIWSLALIDNTVFVAANTGAYAIEDNAVRQIQGLGGTWRFIKLRKHPDCILGCSYQGFFILKKDGRQWKLHNFVEGFAETGTMFEEDREGNIWFSHWIKGVFRLTLNEHADRFSKVEAIKGFYTDQNNTLSVIDDEVIFSGDGGFFRYDAAQNRVVHCEKMEQLFGLHPFSMNLYESPQGNIWAASKSLLSVAFRQEGGGYTTASSAFSALKNKLINGFEHFNFVDDKHIIVNTEEGFAWLSTADTANLQHDSIHVSVRKVYLTNKRDSIINAYLPTQSAIPRLKHQYNSICFEFVAAEFVEHEAVLYSFKLENYDADWSAFSAKNAKEYTKLPKGAYTFKVRAQTGAGNMSQEASFTFVILPAWYETTTAFVLYFILLALLVALLIHYIKRRSKQTIQKIEEQKDLEIQEIEQEKEVEIEKLKQQQLEHHLRHKSRELAHSTMNLIRKNEMLLEVSQDLNKTIDSLKAQKEQKDVLQHLLKMRNHIKQNIEQDNNWKKFEENFDLVYENYLKRLKENYPLLTTSDRKLCAYLKMGLHSKDIAPLLNMSFRSVEMGRYNLRKKLNLSHSDNLTKFLQEF